MNSDVHKWAAGADGARRLEREAEVLAAVRHPGVVELLAADGDGQNRSIATARVDGCGLQDLGPLEPDEVAGLVAGVAATVADLHDLGFVHGAIEPGHVIVGAHGHAVLCSLGYGGRCGDQPAGRPDLPPAFVDPECQPGEPLDPTIDVFGLGALIRHLLAALPEGHSNDASHRLDAIATASTSRRSGRPSARAVAQAVYDAVPSARLTRPFNTSGGRGRPGQPLPPAATVAATPHSIAAGTDGPLEDWRRQLTAPTVSARRSIRSPIGRRKLVGGLAIAALGGAVIFSLRSYPASSRSDGPKLVSTPMSPARPSSPVAETVAAPTTSSRRTYITVPRCSAVKAPLQADIDDDGCAEPLRFDGGVLSTGGGDIRWTVGQPGDAVAVGDWACQRKSTLALLRPSTGEVFRFDGWAAPGRDLVASVLASVEGATAIRAADLNGDGCHELVVDVAGGGQRVVAPTAYRE